jgi:hypothetical protein
MDQSAGSNQSGDDNPTLWSQQQALQLWKYFDGVGAADKNTMVTVESLLLGVLCSNQYSSFSTPIHHQAWARD